MPENKAQVISAEKVSPMQEFLAELRALVDPAQQQNNGLVFPAAFLITLFAAAVTVVALAFWGAGVENEETLRQALAIAALHAFATFYASSKALETLITRQFRCGLQHFHRVLADSSLLVTIASPEFEPGRGLPEEEESTRNVLPKLGRPLTGLVGRLRQMSAEPARFLLPLGLKMRPDSLNIDTQWHWSYGLVALLIMLPSLALLVSNSPLLLRVGPLSSVVYTLSYWFGLNQLEYAALNLSFRRALLEVLERPENSTTRTGELVTEESQPDAPVLPGRRRQPDV